MHCGKEEIVEHNFSEYHIDKEPSETETGSKSKVCNCGYKVTEEIPMLEPELHTGKIIVIVAIALISLSGLFVLYWFVLRKKVFKK